MVVSLFLPDAIDERLHAVLDPARHADDLPGACQAAHQSHEPRDPVGDALDLLGHGTDALELPTRLARERADVLGQRVGLAHEGPQLLLDDRSEEHTSELQSLTNLVCRLLLEKKKKRQYSHHTATRHV